MANIQDNVNARHYNCIAMQEHRKGSLAFDAGAAAASIEVTYPPVILCDPGGGAINLTLPAEADSDGLTFVVFNTANALETITVKDSTGVTTIVTLAQNAAAYLFCDGTTWRGFIGGIV